jgi:hypothetical protein
MMSSVFTSGTIEQTGNSVDQDKLSDTRDAERLAGKASAENVVRWDGVVRHRIDVAVWWFVEVGFVSDLGVLVPVGGENAFAARALERDAESANAAEEVYEA